jgi:hypothetical protein
VKSTYFLKSVNNLKHYTLVGVGCDDSVGNAVINLCDLLSETIIHLTLHYVTLRYIIHLNYVGDPSQVA